MNEMMFGDNRHPEYRARELARRQQGVRHRQRRDPAIPQPGDAPVLSVTTEAPATIAAVECRMIAPETRVFPCTRVGVGWDHLNWSYTETWQTTLPAYPAGTVVRYAIQARAADGETFDDADGIHAYLVGAGPAPTWAQDTVVYQIFVDRFSPGAGRAWNPVTSLRDVYGGTLPGIIEKLDYIADLGCNCLWLTPIFPDEHAHGYHATDYFAINPRLGTLDDAKTLLEQAHARGIRVLLDFVANHVGSAHPAFRRASNDDRSEEHGWFFWRDWPDDYVSFFDVRDLPKVNTDAPGARDYLLRSVDFWLDEVGFDGLRLDHANGPTHDFWTALRAQVEASKPDAWLFGEIVLPPDRQLEYAGQLHGTLDFMLAQALRDTFGFGTLSLSAFDAFLNQHEAFFPADFSRPSFLDNHDMDRFLWIAGNDARKLKIAAVCQFTLSGPPILYCGTELGLSQEHGKDDPDGVGMEECRQPMNWETHDAELPAFFRDLIHLRRAHPVLQHGARRTLHVDDATGVYVYARYDDAETILVALNIGDEPQTVTLRGELARTITVEAMGSLVLGERGSG